MANRHKMQARARGGRTEPPAEVYTGKGSHVAEEAGRKEERFKRGGHKRGGVVVGKAFGGAVRGRADKRKRGGSVKGFAKGGSVWSKAAGSIRGDKGMAIEVMRPGKLHSEMHDNTVKAMGDSSVGTRSGHGEKARHQLRTGGRVGFATGGRPKHEHGKKEDDEDEEDEEDDEDSDGYAYGGVTTYKRGGSLKMHYIGGRGKRHKHAEGGVAKAEADADADDEHRPSMAKGGGCWMAKAFAGSHGQFKAKAHKAGMSTAKYASKEAASPSASTKTKRQANLAKLGAKYGGG